MFRAKPRWEATRIASLLLVAFIEAGVRDAEAPAQKPAQTANESATDRTFTRDQAATELRKINGRIYYDEDTPGKPLARIRLLGTQISDAGLVYLKAFPDVPWLEILNNANVTDAGVVHLKDLTSVRDLSLEGTSVTDAGLVNLQGLTSLESLSLMNTRVKGPGLAHLKQLKNLKRLQLAFCEVSDAGLEQLAGFASLRELGLDDTKVTDAGVKKLRQALPDCRVLWSPLGVAAVNLGNASVPATTPKPVDATPGEWAQWRGPYRDGVCRETGLIQQLPAEGPPLLWENKKVGWGYSTVAVANGRLFVTGKMNRDQPTHLIACNASDGKQVWHCLLAEGENDPFATPTVDRDLVFALSREGELLCAKAADGAVVWRRNFARDFGGTYQSFNKGGGYSESVLVDGDRVICTPGGATAFVVSLDRTSGNTVWTTPLPADFGPQGIDAAGFSSPMLSTACGVRQYVQMTGRGLISVDASTGQTLWTYNKIANVFNNVATPIIRGDYVFASTAHGDSYSGTALLKVISDQGRIQVQEVYRLPERTAANHHGGMVLVGDYIYMGHGYNRGFPLCLEMMTGKIIWRPGRGPGTGSAAVLYADGHIYFTYEDGTVALVEATPKSFIPKGSFQSLPNSRNERAHPVISDGRLYLRGGSWLRCYDIRRN